MFCKYCGSEAKDDAVVCLSCGRILNEEAVESLSNQSQQQSQQTANLAVQDSGNFGWGILGFCFPIVGLILFLSWKQTKPKCSKVAGIGGLIGFLINIVIMISSTLSTLA